MQVNPFNGLRVINDQPVLHKGSTDYRFSALNPGQQQFEGGPVRQGPTLRDWPFDKTLLRSLSPNLAVATSPDTQPSPLGEPPQVDKLGTQVRDYRQTLNAVHADLVSQLKTAQDALKDARKSGDKDAIAAAQASIDDLNTQIQANRDSLLTVHDDVKALREMRQQLAADVKAGNTSALQQDRDAITQASAKVLTDIQA